MRPLALQRRLAHQHARAEADPGRQPVGLGDDPRADDEMRRADVEAVADGESQPVDQRRLDRRAERVAVGRQRLRPASSPDRRSPRRDRARSRRPPWLRPASRRRRRCAPWRGRSPRSRSRRATQDRRARRARARVASARTTRRRRGSSGRRAPGPTSSDCASELTPAIAATPSATHRTTMRRPARPPRRSRSAKRSSAAVGARRRGAKGAFMPRPARAHRLRAAPSACARCGRSARRAPNCG